MLQVRTYCLVFHDYRLAEALAELLRHDPGHDVGGASRREADDELDGPIGVIDLGERQNRPKEHPCTGGKPCNDEHETDNVCLL